MMKNHWPVVFAILVVIISIILGIAASNSTDAGVAILVGVICWMFLFPLAGAAIGGWYGWRIRSPLKWLLAPAAYLGFLLYMIAWQLISGVGSIDMKSYLIVGSLTGIACLAVEVATSVIAWLKRRNI